MGKCKEELLANLQAKIDSLVMLYNNCREANAMLTSEIQKMQIVSENKDLQYKGMEERYKSLLAARSLSESSENISDAKRKIDAIVREIDNCISLLNQ